MRKPVEELPQVIAAALPGLLDAAWSAWKNARLSGMGRTRVGCAILADNGATYVGANVQHAWSNHIHAEVSALAAMVTGGGKEARGIVIVAEGHRFTPCGSCRDWITSLSAGDGWVITQSARGGDVDCYEVQGLLPDEPKWGVE